MSKNILNNIFGRSKWKANMSNDATFEIITSPLLTRSGAKQNILNLANGDYGNIYKRTDIKQLRRLKR